MPETIRRHIYENPDSIEIGTPGKGGTLKIYGDFFRMDEFKRKLENAKTVRQYAQQQLGL